MVRWIGWLVAAGLTLQGSAYSELLDKAFGRMDAVRDSAVAAVVIRVTVLYGNIMQVSLVAEEGKGVEARMVESTVCFTCEMENGIYEVADQVTPVRRAAISEVAFLGVMRELGLVLGARMERETRRCCPGVGDSKEVFPTYWVSYSIWWYAGGREMRTKVPGPIPEQWRDYRRYRDMGRWDDDRLGRALERAIRMGRTK